MDGVDIVFPYRALIAGNEQIDLEMVKQASELCHVSQMLLKVIIESNELRRANLIRRASESAGIILNVIAEKCVGDRVGFKAAGGVRTAEEVATYFALANEIMSEG